MLGAHDNMQHAIAQPDKARLYSSEDEPNRPMSPVSRDSKQFIRSSGMGDSAQGYAHLVKAGPLVFISGVSALASHHGAMPAHLVLEAPGQTRAVLSQIKQLLERAGCCERDIVRMRVYVVDMARDSRQILQTITRWFDDGLGRDAVKPGITLVEVRMLSSEPVLLEIEADAVSSSV